MHKWKLPVSRPVCKNVKNADTRKVACVHSCALRRSQALNLVRVIMSHAHDIPMTFIRIDGADEKAMYESSDKLHYDLRSETGGAVCNSSRGYLIEATDAQVARKNEFSKLNHGLCCDLSTGTPIIWRSPMF
jgi:hypothetical protein